MSCRVFGVAAISFGGILLLERGIWSWLIPLLLPVITILILHMIAPCIINCLTRSNTQTVNFQMFMLVLQKAEEPEIKLPTFAGSWKKQESSRKTSISALLTMTKPLTVWITINCGKF